MQMLVIDADEERAERLRTAFARDFLMVMVPDLRRGEILLEETAFDAVLLCGCDGDSITGLLNRGMQVLALDCTGETPPEVYVIPDESEGELAAAARHAAVTKALLVSLTREKAALKKKLEDLALQNRAKAVLCRTLGFTENQAHKYLEKQAMTLRITKTDAARRILATYEN